MGESVKVLGFIIFLVASHIGVMQIFRLTTYHAYFWKSLPLLLGYSILIAWLLYFFKLHVFFLWQLVLASVWLFVVGRRQAKMAATMLNFVGDDADDVRFLAKSTAKTSSFYTYSSFVYIAVFAGTYVWLYNS